jgi:putative salt-induced outer membrane protein
MSLRRPVSPWHPRHLWWLLGAAFALDARAEAEPDGRWHGSVSVGGSVASGNTTSRTLAANADAARETSADKIALYALANYGSSDVNGVSTRSADLLRIGARYDYNLSERVFAFGGGQAETNKIAGVDSRYAVNSGAGYKLIRDATTTWDVFAGLGYSRTAFTVGGSRSGAELLLGEESTHKLGDATTFKQRLAVYPGVAEVGTRATFDAGVSTTIIGGWTLDTTLAYRYASKVAPGRKTGDTLLTFGFGYKY